MANQEAPKTAAESQALLPGAFPPDLDLIKAQLVGKYRFVSLLAKGKNGAAYKIEDMTTGLR
jgi:hypothetical protein